MLNRIGAIYKKEMGINFKSPIAYVFIILFIIFPAFSFFFLIGGIFEENLASMRSYFRYLPIAYLFFIPGLSMGAWAKERNDETLELLFTFPISEWEVLIGKFLSALSLVAIALATTIIIPLMTHISLGAFDIGQLFAQYFGALLMACTYIAITFYFSSLTKELIISFLLSAFFLFVFIIIGYFPVIVQSSEIFTTYFSWLKPFFVWISLSTHFANFSKGVIDSKDVIYYIGVSVIFFYLTLRTLESRKWS
ncbi:MAG: ABC transporter permease [Spirochaetes bacterium]|nr:ABC transporter permease [Spirochaetota bacterium]